MTKFCDLSVLRTKIYNCKLVYFFGTPVRLYIVYEKMLWTRKNHRQDTVLSAISLKSKIHPKIRGTLHLEVLDCHYLYIVGKLCLSRI